MNNFINTIFRMWNRFAAFLKSDVRNVEQRCKTIEEQLRNEIATLRVELEQARTDAANEITRVDSDIAEHLDAVRWLSAVKRQAPNVQGDAPVVLQ
jgi:hypothetical protein